MESYGLGKSKEKCPREGKDKKKSRDVMSIEGGKKDINYLRNGSVYIMKI